MAHFLGQDQNPILFSSSAIQDISLVVLQFIELARGERKVRPFNPFRVVAVRAEERYCIDCGDVRWFDIVYILGSERRFEICRCCRVEDWG